MNKDSLPRSIRKVIDLVNLGDYAASCAAVEKAFSSLKKDEEYSDFTTQDGIRFCLHRDFDDSLAKVDFDIRQDDIEELDEDNIEELRNEYFEDWQEKTE